MRTPATKIAVQRRNNPFTGHTPYARRSAR
jgi:hypothetical protein